MSHDCNAIQELQVRLEVREGVISEGGIHEGGAAGVLKDSEFHGVKDMQR